MLPNRVRYAFKAMSNLAFGDETRRTAASIAREEGIPAKYLEIILSQLRAAGLLRSMRGVGGGFSLARPPGEIRLSEILAAVGASLSPLPCLAEKAYACDGCSDPRLCLLRALIEPGFRLWKEQIISSTLGELAPEPSTSIRQDEGVSSGDDPSCLRASANDDNEAAESNGNLDCDDI